MIESPTPSGVSQSQSTQMKKNMKNIEVRPSVEKDEEEEKQKNYHPYSVKKKIKKKTQGRATSICKGFMAIPKILFSRSAPLLHGQFGDLASRRAVTGHVVLEDGR